MYTELIHSYIRVHFFGSVPLEDLDWHEFHPITICTTSEQINEQMWFLVLVKDHPMVSI